MRFEVAVVGLGGMGSAIAAHCARRGAAVVGFEQFARGHELGSSSGRSRMIRKAYFEDPAYVPLLLRAYDLWRELEQRTKTDLLRLTGLLMVGSERAEIIMGARRAAREHHLSLELFTTDEIRQRYPTLRVREGEVGLFEPDGGVLDPERAVEAHLTIAETAGAELRFASAVEHWEKSGDGFVLRLADGSPIESRALILSLGPWFENALAALGVNLRIQRNLQAWFTPATNDYDASRFPPFLLERAGLPAPLYGFPDFGEGVKAAFHSHGELTTAASVGRDVDLARDVEPIARAMEQWMPGAAHTFRRAKPCMYSLTPDGHFLLDRHPAHPRLILCGGFSGHGFKFAPVIGEICAELALEKRTRHEIDFLSLGRFTRRVSR